MPKKPPAEQGGAAPPEPKRSTSERRLNDLDIRTWMRFTKSWFVCNPGPRSKQQLQHPAKFPEAMVREFILYFTREGQTVLDPFAGVGSAVSAAAACGRRGIGIELCEAFHRAGADREGRDLRQEIHLQGDAREAASLCRAEGYAQVDYVITSPPYWDMLRQSRGNVQSAQKDRAADGLRTEYSGVEGDLGTISEYEAFLDELASIFSGLRPLLRPNGYLTVVIQNIRVPGGEVKPLAWDLTARLSSHFTFKGERIWLQDNKRLGCWGWPSEFVTNVHHHYCLNFKNDRA